jgi:hypothetical protein
MLRGSMTGSLHKGFVHGIGNLISVHPVTLEINPMERLFVLIPTPFGTAPTIIPHEELPFRDIYHLLRDDNLILNDLDWPKSACAGNWPERGKIISFTMTYQALRLLDIHK